MLSLDFLHTELPAMLARFGASVEVRSGCPDPASPLWKLLVEFSHSVGVGTVTVWENAGCCDIDFLAVGAADGVFFHGEFVSNAALLEFVAFVLKSLLHSPAPPNTALQPTALKRGG